MKALGIAGLGLAILSAATVASAGRSQQPLRILLLYDMEGASGVLSGATFDPGRPDSFAVGRKSLIDDVNAVVAGLFDAGAAQVDVENTHGAGGDSLVPRDRLDKRAGILTRERRLEPYVPGPPSWRPGFGTWGIPVVFASGDDRLRATLATAMPWVEYVVVKRITSPTVAEPLASDVVRRELQASAARAVRSLRERGRTQVMRLTFPARAGLLPSYPLLLPPGLASLPGFEKHGDTVTFAATDYRSAYWGMFALQRIARAFSVERACEDLAHDSAGAAIQRRLIDSVWARSAAFEAGKWKP